MCDALGSEDFDSFADFVGFNHISICANDIFLLMLPIYLEFDSISLCNIYNKFKFKLYCKPLSCVKPDLDNLLNRLFCCFNFPWSCQTIYKFII